MHVTAAQAAGDIWLRLTKAGTNYTGEYSFDGTTWTRVPRRRGGEPDGGPGLRPPRLRAAGLRRGRDRLVRLLHARRAGPAVSVRVRRGPRRRVRRRGAGQDASGTRSSARTTTKYAVADGALRITTAAGDIYTNGDPAATRNFILQQAATPADWVIETKVSATPERRLRAGRPDGPTGRQQLHQVRRRSPTRARRSSNRIELRSEVGGAIQDPQPQVHEAGTGLRRTSGCA